MKFIRLFIAIVFLGVISPMVFHEEKELHRQAVLAESYSRCHDIKISHMAKSCLEAVFWKKASICPGHHAPKERESCVKERRREFDQLLSGYQGPIGIKLILYFLFSLVFLVIAYFGKNLALPLSSFIDFVDRMMGILQLNIEKPFLRGMMSGFLGSLTICLLILLPIFLIQTTEQKLKERVLYSYLDMVEVFVFSSLGFIVVSAFFFGLRETLKERD